MPILLTADGGSQIGERFRVLRTHVELAGPSTIMITSALDQEGKTLCAANLTVALAMRISKGVVLVDADLRNPSVGKSFGDGNGRGLVECLTGESRWQDCLMPTAYERLLVLPAGQPSRLAPELLGCERMQVVINELRAKFPDHVLLFDTPPILLTSDPLVVARYMDHIFLVVRGGVTPRGAVLKAIEALGPERLRGVIFNDAATHPSDHYYYSGNYPYGYGSRGSNGR